jgi:hypothetical protein
MELGLAVPASQSKAARPQRRLTRARWWFEHMRQVVEQAADWQPDAPLPGGKNWPSTSPR